MPATQDDELILGMVQRLAAASGRTVPATADAIRFLLFDVTYLRAGEPFRRRAAAAPR